MNPWVAFVLGLIVGWIIEWIIDWLFWRRRDSGPTAAELDLRQQLDDAREKIRQLEADLEAALSRKPVQVKDRLQEINGIGNVFAKRFNEAGIFSFAELAAVTPERAREIINPQYWQEIEPEAWIAEARALAAAQEKGA